MPGGCVLLVEKVLGATDVVDARLVTQYQEHKAAHGYTREQIERKRMSLEGVLVPITARWNEDMLRAAGFEHVDCVWRWGQFAAWIAIVDWEQSHVG
jgi:tRNA (cmo5U34)-methyltransferase